MISPKEEPPGRKGRWVRRVLVGLVVFVALAVAALEYVARQIKVETNANGTSVIQPRGFFSKANVVGFLRVAYTQWVDADSRRECFSVGQGCSLTGNDPDRDGKVDQIYVFLKDEAILPYLRGYDAELGGLRLFVHMDAGGTPRVDDESLAELRRVVQSLFDDGMQRYADQLERRR